MAREVTNETDYVNLNRAREVRGAHPSGSILGANARLLPSTLCLAPLSALDKRL